MGLRTLIIFVCIITLCVSADDLFGDVSSYSTQQSRKYEVPNVDPSSRGLTMSMVLEPLIVSPIKGNITLEMEVVARYSLNRSPLFHIEAQFPWRKPRVAFYLQKSPLFCQIEDRLRTNQKHSLTVEIVRDDSHLIVYIFLDGILKNRCMQYANIDPFEKNATLMEKIGFGSGENTISFSLEDTPKNQFLHTQEVLFWPRVLPYSTVQYLSTAQIVMNSPEGQAAVSAGPERSVHSWYQQMRGRYALSQVQEEVCDAEGSCTSGGNTDSVDAPLTETVGLLLWPYFYSERITSSYPNWYADHIVQSVEDAISAIENNIRTGVGSVDVYIPLTADHQDRMMAPLQLLQEKFTSAELGVTIFTTENTAKPFAGKGDGAVYPYSEVANRAIDLMLSGEATPVSPATTTVHMPSYLALVSSHIYPELGWLGALLGTEKKQPGSVVGGKIVSASGELLHFGFEMLELPYTGGTEILLTPHDRYRGYWPFDSRTREGAQTASAVSRDLLLMSSALWRELNGFDRVMSPVLESADFCLRASGAGHSVLVSGDAAGVSLQPLVSREKDSTQTYTSEQFNPLHLTPPMLASLTAFSARWREVQAEERRRHYITPAKLTWVIHCGGSQGMEAATILQHLHKFLDVRTLVRRYRTCEHSDTISGMPAYFRDVLEMTALKTFTEPFKAFRSPAHECNSSRVCVNSDQEEDGSIVLYARDYRELGRWVPRDTSYVIGRYMYETDSLPRAWVANSNILDEVWVPSTWQKETFVSAGVKEDNTHVLAETVDSFYFDPSAVSDLPLPGTMLDGFARDDPERPYAFCSVFKMESRKGWKELIESFMREFKDAKNVVLVLRTYMHTGTGIAADNFNPWLIRKEIDDHLRWRGLPESDASDGKSGPRIEIVAEHLPSSQLVQFYKSCDAFVLSTHAEGWGLPTHEAMVMGLPIITTNWGGSTEFVTKDSGLLINVPKLEHTEGDDWLRGFNWATIDMDDLQQNMRRLYSDRAFGVELGKRGQKFVERFSPDAVARSYADRLAHIYDKVIPTLKDTPLEMQSRYPSHGNAVLSKLDIKYELSGRFKICSVRTYKKLPSPAEDFLFDYKGNPSLCNIAIMSTWAPRMCGIATFSAALRDSLLEACPEGSRVDVVVVKHKDQSIKEYNHSEAKLFVSEFEPMEYIEAAQYLNKERYHTVLIQYEYGMMSGDNLICMLRELKAPKVLTTIHTVHLNLFENMHAWVQQTSFLSKKLVVMTHSMRHALSAFHAIPTRDVAVIPHGGPDVPYERFDGTPLQTLFPGKKVILSNGLIHPMKGIEIMIRAMPRILEEVPDAVYLVHGRPHPTGMNCEEYYQAIMEEANYTAPDNIFFNRSFALTSDLYYMLKNTRVYVNAYTDQGQSVSGTLAMALGLGTVSISTPYSYAVEMLRNNTGRMAPFQDVSMLAEAVIDVLKDDENHDRMSRNAYDMAQQQTWKRVAQGYLDL